MASKKPNAKGGERAERRRTDRAIDEAAKKVDQKAPPVRDPFTNLGVRRPSDVGTKELLLKVGILNTQLDMKDEYIQNLETRLEEVLAEKQIAAAEEAGDAAEARENDHFKSREKSESEAAE